MAAFTTLALLGLGLAGGLGAGKAIASQGKKAAPAGSIWDKLSDPEVIKRTIAKARGDTSGSSTVAVPPSTSLAASAAVSSAETAAARQRKRAAAGSTYLTGDARSGMRPMAVLNPRTLIGGG